VLSQRDIGEKRLRFNQGFILTSPKEKPSTDKAPANEAAQKILRSVPFDQGFHFATGMFTGETAVSLFSFYEELRTIDLQSVQFHFLRGDFQKWMRTILGDEELASRLDKISSGLIAEELRKVLVVTVQARLAELQTVSNASNKSTLSEVSGKSSDGPSRKFNVEELKNYSGQEGKPAYIVFSGKVYDVTDSALWQDGNHLGDHQAGKDLTAAIKSAPHGDEVLAKVKQVGILA
jgi:predicted heme/steroid binding protein